MKAGTIFKTAALAAALSVSGTANADIFFDVEGTGGANSVRLNLFDWFPDNGLLDNAIPIPTLPGSIEFTYLLQGSLNLGALNAGTEVTFQARVPMAAQIAAQAAGFIFTIDTLLPGGTFDIYFDDNANSDDITGLGYDDGVNILSGSILDNPNQGTVILGRDDGLLDQFGVDNQGGVTTLGISGNLPLLEIEIDSFDLAFFPADINGDTIDVAGGHDLTFSSDNLAAFTNANPSDQVVGVAPDYGNGVNDNACGAGGGVCDLHVESDGRSPFLAQLVPAPAGLALFGMGLLALGAMRARRRG